MATAVVNVRFENGSIVVDPETVKINVGDTVKWVAPRQFQVHMPLAHPHPHAHPKVSNSGPNWEGIVGPFTVQSQRYKYDVSSPDHPVLDPIIQVLP